MRTRILAAALLVTLPAALSAQRFPMGIFGRGHIPPAELPPRPGEIARDMAYRRMHYSVESYPMVEYFQAPGFTGNPAYRSWTSIGAGTRVDYRVIPYVSATLDMTSSFIGGPADMETAEIGARIRPERSAERLYPFVDLRLGYAYAYNSMFTYVASSYTQPGAYGAQYAQGFGALAGLGAEYTLSRTLSLTTSAAVMHDRMRSFVYQPSAPSSRPSYPMTVYRYTLGLRWNPVRLVSASDADLK